MTVEEMLARISSRELTEWQAYYTLEPFGARQGYVQAAIVASTVANVNRGKDSRPFKPEDFMPQWDEGPDEVLTPEETVKAFARALGGRG